MTDEVLKWLAQSGVGGLIGGISIWMLNEFRRESREAHQKNNDWMVLIHSRLSSLDADTIPPPGEPAEPRREKRLRTAPVGYPVVKPKVDR